MTAEQIKNDIKYSIQDFLSGNLTLNALKLFNALGYVTERQAPFNKKTKEEFSETYISNEKKFDKTKAKFNEWKYVDLLFQLSKEEVLKQTSLFDTKKVDSTIIETYLFFAIELSKEQYSRTDLSLITREVNRLFPMPSMILFRHGSTLTLSVINRRLHKRDESKDVLEKVTQIKDINISNPHRAHIEILFDLSFDELKAKFEFTNFVELHNAWQKTLDTKELNRKFFNELANWYFWATTKVAFPDDEIEDKEIRNATGVIRLITRLMFVWFLKEKNLVPDDLFDEKKLKQLLKYTDEKKSSYYKAILQNLFFATLNTEMGKRKFRSAADKSQSNHYFIHNLFRYENEFVKPKETLEKYFDPIPFLNGGLFECLDKQIEKNGKLQPVRIDGFSDREDNVLKVPDELFFSEKEKVIDLSKVYGTPKKSKEKVRGLIDILNSYKFTIAENTPIEEEVALDPELLGKVFENLLANYNPETQTTARKQTGSFYTPREIVNYMVDESLLAYLKHNLNDKLETETNLRELLSYSEKELQFSNAEREKLINAIDNIKIIDPACGSGAFPMGILHKLVHTLHKLDPKNELWKQRQIEKASAIDDILSREAAIETIEEAFENNELDYGRKLYLIENCIYGVDIQPIAVQISKLRFFISLIVEQKTNPKKENLGVRPLPNLETKFVAANTLMMLEKEQSNLFTNPEIEKKKEQLKKVRHDYFEARTPKRKENCRVKDKELRDELSELLVNNHDLQPATAKRVAAWNPYDQNASATFFDMEWMFGLKNGFDIVIGNPPFISYYARRSAKLDTATLRYFQANYDFITDTKLDGKFNSIMFFIERAFKLLSNKASTFFILDIAFNDVPYRYIRKYLLENASINKLVTGLSAFENVYSDQILLQFTKESIEKRKKNLVHFYSDFNNSEMNYCEVEQTVWLSNKLFAFAPPHDDKLEIIFKKIEKFPSLHQLFPAKLVRTCLSLAGHEDEFLLANNKSHKTKPVLSYIQNAKNLPERYSAIINPEKVVFDEELKDKLNQHYRKDAYNEIRRQPKALGLGSLFAFTHPKLFVRQSADKIIATYTEIDCAANTSFYIISAIDEDGIESKIPLKYLLAILNSKLLTFYALAKKIIITGDKKQPQMMIKPFKTLPIAPLPNKEQNSFITIVDYILLLKKQSKDSSFMERLIDAMVYELYLPDEIQNAKCEVLKHLNNLPELKEGEDHKNLKTIERVYKELSDSKHPVTVAMFKMDTIEEVAIIEGKK